jgi:DNA-binding response OmpR family regulator
MVRLHQQQELLDSAPAQAQKILYIEDDHQIAKLVTEELAEQGFDVILALDGHEGFIAILKGLPDLVLCDIGLPHMSGFEILDRLNELSPWLGRVPFIFVTALTDGELERGARRLGADDYITKPIDFEMLEATIKARLAMVATNPMWRKVAMFSDREAEVLTWVARGKTSAQIAETLGSARQDVEFHLENARVKLERATRASAKTKAAVGQLTDP